MFITYCVVKQLLHSVVHRITSHDEDSLLCFADVPTNQITCLRQVNITVDIYFAEVPTNRITCLRQVNITVDIYFAEVPTLLFVCRYSSLLFIIVILLMFLHVEFIVFTLTVVFT